MFKKLRLVCKTNRIEYNYLTESILKVTIQYFLKIHFMHLTNLFVSCPRARAGILWILHLRLFYLGISEKGGSRCGSEK